MALPHGLRCAKRRAGRCLKWWRECMRWVTACA